MFRFEPVRPVVAFAWLLLSVAEWSSAEPCAELGRAIDVLIPAVRNSGKRIDQPSNAQEVAGAINAYADAAEKLAQRYSGCGRSWKSYLPTNRQLARKRTGCSKLFNQRSTP